MLELVYRNVSKTFGESRVGSIPTAPTTIRYLYRKLRRTCGEQCSFFDKQSRAGETSPI